MKIKEVAMIIAIAVMSALFVGLLVDAIYERPKYEDFCIEEYRPEPYPKYVPFNESCVLSQEEQEKVNQCYKDKGTPRYDYDSRGCQKYRECDFCSKNYQEENERYERNTFLIIAPIAAVAIIIGLLWSFEVVGTGLMFAGILLLIYATGRYFPSMGKITRVIVIFVELLILIWISIKKLRK